MDSELISLNKYISSSGFCSRREADKLIEQARVTVNDELVLPGARIHPGDDVAIDGERLHNNKSKRPIYIALNKPAGVTSTTDPRDKTNVVYFLNHPKRIFPVGRLDKDSDGLILLTNDGDIVNKILRASNHHEKEYIVTVDKAINADFVRQMSGGLPILDTVTRPCFVRQEGSRRFRIILTQGLNRQIRRMCELLDYKVVTLTRIRVMNISLDTLPVGKWRYLTLPEMARMNEMVQESSKTDDAPQKKKKASSSTYIPKKKAAAAAPAEEESFDIEEWDVKPAGKKYGARPKADGAKAPAKERSFSGGAKRPTRSGSVAGPAVRKTAAKKDAAPAKLPGKGKPGDRNRGSGKEKAFFEAPKDSRKGKPGDRNIGGKAAAKKAPAADAPKKSAPSRKSAAPAAGRSPKPVKKQKDNSYAETLKLDKKKKQKAAKKKR